MELNTNIMRIMDWTLIIITIKTAKTSGPLAPTAMSRSPTTMEAKCSHKSIITLKGTSMGANTLGTLSNTSSHRYNTR